MKRPLLARAFILGLLTFAGCKADAPGEFRDVPEDQRYGGTAVIGYISDIPDINPLTSTETVGADVQQFVLFIPVIHYDENLQPIPALAKSWEVNEDTTLLTFHLRDDVYWHDGVKTTAEDLAFTFARARDPATGYANAAHWTYYGDGEVVDSFTFRVTLRPHADFLDPWRTLAPVPKHILGDVPPAEMKQQAFNSSRPVGNGPFRFVSHIENQSWTFEANPDYPEELGGRPYLDRIVYRSIPEATTLLTELLTGGVDFIVPTPEQAVSVEADPNLRLLSYQDRAFVIIGYNQRRPPFGDVRVRRALSMAMNRQRIVDSVLYGHGTLANSTVPPFFWQYDADAGADLKFDPAGAQALLTEAGYVKGADGLVHDAQGRPLSFTLITNQANQTRADIAAIVQSDLKQIGIDMRIQILEFGTMIARLNDVEKRDFDAFLVGWRTEFKIDDSDLFHCDKRDGLYQWVGHCDPALDALMDTLPLIANRDEARPLWQDYQRRVADQQPYTFIYFQERLFGVRNRLRNVNPDPRGDLVGIDRWYIAPDQRAGAAGASSGAAVPDSGR